MTSRHRVCTSFCFLVTLIITITCKDMALKATALAATSSHCRTFFITGATDGIGRHTAEKLASDGHGLIIHGRRKETGMKLVKDLEKLGASFVHYLNADLSDLDEVEALAQQAQDLELPIDVLINNAGVFDPEHRHSKQGYDTTWAVNVVAHFLLTRRLLPLIALSSSDDKRIITTSSISQSGSVSDIDALFEKQPSSYSAHKSYSQSKWGDLMLTAQFSKLFSSLPKSSPLSNIKCLTMDPGTVNTKMLLAGWGACGIPVKRANNTYKLAATSYGKDAANGSYHFGGRASLDAKDDKKLNYLWEKLEEATGCTYNDIDSIN